MTEVTILDGGMGGEISARLEGAGHGLWSAKALVEAPDLVVQIHREFIDAGARMIITNTYSTIPHYLEKEGLGDQYLAYTELGGKLARQAADESGESVQVLGCIPPLNESYRAELVPPAAEARPIYGHLVKTLESYVDAFICETMSSIAESRNAMDAVLEQGNGKPMFLAWTLNETPGVGLRSGESISEAFSALEEYPVAGYFLNCTTPECIVATLPALKAMTDKPLGCYPNRLEQVPDGWTLDNEVQNARRNDLDTAYYVDQMQACIAAGATIVGGCCGIGPSYIEALNSSLAAAQA